MFALHDVEVRRGMTTVMSGCTLSMQGGQTVVLSGNNGAGKSTLLETIAGLLPLEHGRVRNTRAPSSGTQKVELEPLRSTLAWFFRKTACSAAKWWWNTCIVPWQEAVERLTSHRSCVPLD